MPQTDTLVGTDPIPIDAALTRGELQNGLAYFLLPSDVPPNKIYINFIVNVGTIHEGQGERGFARLLSQLSFRKSAVMADGEAASLLFDATGVKETKYHVNVDFEHTTFAFSVPCDDTHNRGFALLTRAAQWLAGVLGSLDLSDEKVIAAEIKSLLATIEEEKASEGVAGQAARLALDGTPYASRQLRGNAGDIASATPAALSAFYKRHFHAMNASVILVGDFKKYNIPLDILNKHLGSVPAVSGGAANKPVSPSDLKLRPGPLLSISRHTEGTSRILIEFRVVLNESVDACGKMAFLQRLLADEVMRGFMRQRIMSIASKLDLQEPIVNDRVIGTVMSLVEVAFTCASGKELDAFERVITEVERLRRFGASDEEFNEYQSLAASTLGPVLQMSSSDSSGSDQTIAALADRIRAGLSPIYSGPRILMRLLSALKKEHLLQAANRLSFDSSALFILLSDKSSATDVDFHGKMEAVQQSSTIAATPSDITLGGVAQIQLKSPLPPAGKIIRKEAEGPVHTFELSNGMFVLAVVEPKSSDDEAAEEDGGPEVSVSFSAHGGTAEVYVNEKDKFPSAIVAGILATSLGLGTVDLAALPFNGGLSMPAFSLFLFERTLMVHSQSSSIPSLDLLFTVIHDIFTSEESKWVNWNDSSLARELGQLREELRQPLPAEAQLEQRCRELNWQSNSLIRQLTESDLDAFDPQWARQYLRKLCSDQPAAWKMQLRVKLNQEDIEDTDAFAVQMAHIESLLEKYIASIPARDTGNVEEKFHSAVMTLVPQIKFHPGVKVDELFVDGSDAERSTLRISFPLDNVTNALEVSAVDMICLLLEAHFFELMRDTTAGNVDSVSVVPSFPFSAIFPGELNITFTCDPNIVDNLLQLCLQSIKKLSSTGPTKQQLAQSRQLLLSSPSQLSGLVESLNPDGTTLFGIETNTDDITKVMNVELAKELIHYILPLKAYTAVKLFSQKLQAKRKAGQPLVVDESEDEAEDESFTEDEDEEPVAKAAGKRSQTSSAASARREHGGSKPASGSGAGIAIIGAVVAVLGAVGFFYMRSRRGGDSK